MTPDVVVDIGNTRMKWGRSRNGSITEMVSLSLDQQQEWVEARAAWGLQSPLKWAVAGVNPEVSQRFQEWATNTGDEVLFLKDYRAVPLHHAVDAPEQVGIDHLLNAFAAHCMAHPHPAIIISVGTATTIDLVDASGVFQGGVIIPGPRLMAESLHAHTAKLPLVEANSLPPVVAPGKNTNDAILAGIRAAIVGATILLVSHYGELAEQPWVFITGGAAGDLSQFQFRPRCQGTRFIPTLTLEGIRIAAETLS